MTRFNAVLIAMAMALMAISSCLHGGGKSLDPVLPGSDTTLKSQVTPSGDHGTNLWGYYDVFIDTENGTVEAVENRQAFFTANVTNFLNGKSSGLSFHINEIIAGTGYTDVDIDVAITHPFPGLPQYNGYDVRGVFMGDGSSALQTGDVQYPVNGTDQFMMNDPDSSGGDNPGGAPDGYTRWFNKTEFSVGGMPLFQYTKGKLATPGYNPLATLCPYRYFADDLGTYEDIWSWLLNNPEKHGQFSSGATNERNYYLRFPNAKGVKYGYAVIANWGGMEPQYHPSNAPEAVACSVTDNSDVYYVDSGNKGGDVILDFSLWDWSGGAGSAGQPSAIYVESSVLSTPHQLSPSEIVPIGGTDEYSTWHVDIPADNISGPTGNEYWIIAEYDQTYANNFGVHNLVEDESLKAYFRYPLTIGSGGPGSITVITPNGGETIDPGATFEITWTSVNVTGNVVIEYSKDDFVSDINEISPDEANDGSYQWYIPCDPSDSVKVRVKSIDKPSIFDDSDDNFIIIGTGWAQSWGEKLTYSYCGAHGVATDKLGNVYIYGKFNGTTDFDPGATVENHDTNGGYDQFLCKYTICGEYLWTRTFGGTEWENGWDVACDSDGNPYVIGYFGGTVDFDPDPTDATYKTANGSNDAFLVKFTPDGDFVWVRAWGGSAFDASYDVACDDFGNVYTTGWFYGSVNMNGSGGSDPKTSKGGWDCFLSKYDTNGNYIWAKTWGGPSANYDWGTGVDVDSNGNPYCTGWFSGTVDFDPGTGDESYTAAGDPGLYINKFDSSGNQDWARTWGGSNANSWDFSPNICVSGSDVVVAARFIGTVDFDPGAPTVNYTSYGGQDVCVSKFDTSGNFQWALAWGSGGDETARGAAIDSNGNVYISAEFSGNIDFDPDPSDSEFHQSNGVLDLSLSKFDSSGDFLWVRTYGGSGNDRPGTVDLDMSGNPYIVGYIQGQNINLAPSGPPCNADPDIHSAHGETDAYISKYFPDGCW